MTDETSPLDYSPVADQQLDDLEAGDNPGLYNAVLDTCELVFRAPGQAQAMSTAITTDSDGVVMRLSVVGYAPWKIFWTTNGPRIEAVLPHPDQ